MTDKQIKDYNLKFKKSKSLKLDTIVLDKNKTSNQIKDEIVKIHNHKFDKSVIEKLLIIR